MNTDNCPLCFGYMVWDGETWVCIFGRHIFTPKELEQAIEEKIRIGNIRAESFKRKQNNN